MSLVFKKVDHINQPSLCLWGAHRHVQHPIRNLLPLSHTSDMHWSSAVARKAKMSCYRFFGAKKLWSMTCPVQTNHILVPNDIFLTKTQESFSKFYEKAIQTSNMSKYDASPKNQVTIDHALFQLPRPAFPAACSSGRSSKSLHQHKRHSSEAIATGAFHRSATQVDFCCCTHSIPLHPQDKSCYSRVWVHMHQGCLWDSLTFST